MQPEDPFQTRTQPCIRELPLSANPKVSEGTNQQGAALHL
ncbi:MAG: hypothetical protein H6Q31_1638 [Bacteroidetes bacterium]|nr:hypothetical protein [Bacteroidota bacterium]